ncbi:aminotransferase class I/II-fold pyridoxal phosphate-dependent enzyme, partial [Candidatus Omnitrophota bacterium]
IIFGKRRHSSIASIDDKIFKNTITVNGVSKSFAMTGWRIGYMASPDEGIIQAIKNLQSHSTSNPTSISQKAALEAIKGNLDAVQSMVREFEKRRDYIVERIRKIKGLSCIKPEGAFYVFCRIEKKGLSSMEFTESLLKEAKVAVVPGKAFGSDEHIRISFATGMQDIQKGMDRIERWLEER